MADRSIRIKKVGDKYQVSGNFSTFVWKDRDSNCFIAFIPELDLVAYHTSKNKALESLEMVMNEFFRYAIEKRTLDSELIRLGWKETDDTFEAPSMESVASKNQQFSAVLNNEEFTRQNRHLAIAV